MHSQNNSTTPTNSSLYRFFKGIYRRLTKSGNNQLELGPINLEIQPSVISYTPQPITDNFSEHVEAIHGLMLQTNTDSLMPETNRYMLMLQAIFSQFPPRKLDIETRSAMERDMREWRSTNREEAARWWADVGRSRMKSALAVPLETLNSTRLESYSNLVIDDEFICPISRDIMTHPVYDPAFPYQRYDAPSIIPWLNEHGTNPCTRTPLSITDLVYDNSLKERIDQFVNSTLTQRSYQF